MPGPRVDRTARPPRPAGPWKHGPIPVIGLIGGIGAGKSRVAALLAERGCVRASTPTRWVTPCSTSARCATRSSARFGAAILDRVGFAPTSRRAIDRRALGAIVFADPAALAAARGDPPPADAADLRAGHRPDRPPGPGAGRRARRGDPARGGLGHALRPGRLRRRPARAAARPAGGAAGLDRARRSPPARRPSGRSSEKRAWPTRSSSTTPASNRSRSTYAASPPRCCPPLVRLRPPPEECDATGTTRCGRLRSGSPADAPGGLEFRRGHRARRGVFRMSIDHMF